MLRIKLRYILKMIPLPTFLCISAENEIDHMSSCLQKFLMDKYVSFSHHKSYKLIHNENGQNNIEISSKFQNICFVHETNRVSIF